MELFTDNLIIFGAKYLIFLMIGVAFGYFLKQPRDRQKRLVVFGFVTAVMALAVARISSQAYYDPRPFVAGNFVPLIPHDPDNGFPSDHTLLAVTVAAVVFYSNRKLGKILFILSMLVGASRVLSGVHSWLDITGSVVISAGVAFLVDMYVMPKINRAKMYSRYFN